MLLPYGIKCREAFKLMAFSSLTIRVVDTKNIVYVYREVVYGRFHTGNCIHLDSFFNLLLRACWEIPSIPAAMD
jgi:hypothetical protein